MKKIEVDRDWCLQAAHREGDSEVGAGALSEFAALVERVSWRPIETAPKDGTFVLFWCAEDQSRWLASWQGGQWYGVDELGLTRQGHSAGDPDYVTGWFVNAWMPLPDGPQSAL